MVYTNEALLELGELQNEAERLARGSRSDREQATVLVQRIKTVRESGMSSLEMRSKYAVLKNEQLRKELGRLGEYRPKLSEEESRSITPLFTEWLRTIPHSTNRMPGDKSSVETSAAYEERATVLLGRPISQTYSGTSGAQGGTLVPLAFTEKLYLGMAQYSPLLDPDVVTLEKSDTYSLPSATASAWDLSTFKAQRVGAPSGYGDAVQFAAQNIPLASASLLVGYIYKTALNVTLELLQDDTTLMEKIAKAYGIAFGRGIGTDLAIGSGINDTPQGLLTGAYPSGKILGTGDEQAGNQGATGNITAQDFLDVYFSLNRVYRQSEKCAWVMNDAVYQRVRNSVDNIGRPLLNVQDDKETILGKRVLVDPNFPGSGGDTSPYVGGSVVFGDLSYYRARVSALSMSKVAEFSGGIEYGIFQIIGRMRANGQVIDPTRTDPTDPTTGVYPPIISASVS